VQNRPNTGELDAGNLRHVDSPRQLFRTGEQDMATQRNANSKWKAYAALLGAKLPSSAKAVGRSLVWRANLLTDACFPGVKSLMADTGLAERTVINALGVLRNAGFITSKRRRQTSNSYTLNWKKLEGDFDKWQADVQARSKASNPDVHEHAQQVDPNVQELASSCAETCISECAETCTQTMTREPCQENNAKIRNNSASRMNAGWRLSDADKAWAESKGYNYHQIMEVAERLSTWSKGKSVRDLSAEWRKWIAKEKPLNVDQFGIPIKVDVYPDDDELEVASVA
jgi:hypothetical protein